MFQVYQVLELLSPVLELQSYLISQFFLQKVKSSEKYQLEDSCAQ